MSYRLSPVRIDQDSGEYVAEIIEMDDQDVEVRRSTIRLPANVNDGRSVSDAQLDALVRAAIGEQQTPKVQARLSAAISRLNNP